MERGLPQSRVISLRVNPPNPLHRASTTQSQSPNRPSDTRPGGLRVQSTTANTSRRASAPSQSARPPVVRNPEDGDELPPPPYSSQDPEPEATRILQERLAAETNVEPSTTVPSSSTPQAASNPALASAQSSSAPNSESTRPGLIDSNPPSDPQMAQVWEESQLDEAKRASLAWREQQELEEAMRLSLAEAEAAGVGSSTEPGTSGHAQSEQDRLPVVNEDEAATYGEASSSSQQPNPDLMGLVGGLGDLTFSNSEHTSSASHAAHNQNSILDDDGPSGLNQQPLVPSKTGLVMQSKNPFLSQAERETSNADGSSSHLDSSTSAPVQAGASELTQPARQDSPQPARQDSPGSTHTSQTTQPIYAPPPGPPPPHLRIPTPPAQSPSSTQNQTSPASRPLPRTPVSPDLSSPPVPQAPGPLTYSPQLASSSQQPSASTANGVYATRPGLPPRKPSRRKSTYVPLTQGEDPLEMLRDFDTVFLGKRIHPLLSKYTAHKLTSHHQSMIALP